jgi:hypothetical protein
MAAQEHKYEYHYPAHFNLDL